MPKDDIINSGKVSKSTKALDSLNNALEETKRQTESIDTSALENFPGLASKAAKEHKNLTSVITEETKAISKMAKEIGSAESQIKDVSRSLQGFMSTMKQTISVSNIYTTALEEMRQGQEAYAQSLAMSTDALSSASTENQKYIDQVHDASVAARGLAATYGVEYAKIKKIGEDLVQSFSMQINATGASIEDVQKEIFLFSRYMGIDAPEAIERMTDRMKGSTKTLTEVRQETIRVAKVVDDYANSLKSMGQSALEAGVATKKDFLSVLKKIRGEFQGGRYDAETFAKSTSALFRAAKESGYTPEQAQKAAGAFGTMISELGKSSNFFGNQMVLNLRDNLDQIQDAQLKLQVRKITESNQPIVSQIAPLTQALAGSKEGTMILVEHIKKLSPELQQVVIQQAAQGDALSANIIREMVSGNKLSEEVAKGEDEKNKEALSFYEKLDELMKEGSKPQRARHMLAKETHKWQQTILKWLEKFPLLAAGIAAAAQFRTNFYLRSIDTTLKTKGIGGGDGLTGGKGKGRLGKLGGMVKAGAALFLAERAFTDVSMAMSGKESKTDVQAGGYLHKSGVLGADSKALLGKDKSLSGYMSTELYGATNVKLQQLKLEAVRVRGGEFKLLKKRKFLLEKEVIKMQSVGALSDKELALQKKKIVATQTEIDQINAKIGKRERLNREESKRLDVSTSMQQHTLLKAGLQKGAGMLGEKGDVRKAIRAMLDTSLLGDKHSLKGTKSLWASGGGADIFSSMLGGKAGRGFAQKAGALGFSEEKLRKIFEQERYGMATSFTKRTGASLDWLKGAKAPSMAPSSATNQMRASAASGSSVQIQGSGDTGAPGETTYAFNASGDRVETTTAFVKVTTKNVVRGPDVNKAAVHDAREVDRMKGTSAL